MKAYKVNTSETEFKNLTGRIFYQVNGQTVLLATPTEGMRFYYNSTFNHLQKVGLLEEVDLLQEKWIHPHLFKPIKVEVLSKTQL